VRKNRRAIQRQMLVTQQRHSDVDELRPLRVSRHRAENPRGNCLFRQNFQQLRFRQKRIVQRDARHLFRAGGDESRRDARRSAARQHKLLPERQLRQLRQARMRKRMMAAVPKASVVITNPTHFAVALQYERGMNAPVCVAKGVDLIARKIREVAERHEIPVVENPPLARALHGTVEIDQEIPPEHYRAVAEIIGYIMRLRRMVGGPRRL